MPRKLRCISLVLVVAFSASITSQAVQASPIASNSVGAGFNGGELFTAAWSWFAARTADLGHLMSVNIRPGTLRKDGSTIDPNNGAASNGKPCALGTGVSPVALNP
jgi:hypothetical protein